MRKLNIELVPDGCWYSNLRSALPPSLWEIIKKDARIRANGKCSICGKTTSKLEAHERWSYDEEKGVQKLEEVVSVCHDCHSAIHMERTAIKGDIVRAEEHYMKVNGCTYAQMKQDRSEANKTHQRRNKIEWQADTSWLNKFINGKQ